MNFDEIKLLSGNGDEVMSLSYQNPAVQRSYILKAFTGLDVDGISARFYGSGSSGQRFYTMGLGKREVVLRIVVNPDYSDNQTVDSLRAQVYRAISSNRTGTLQVVFLTEEFPEAAISGFVTKIEVAHFSNVPELQITMDCSRDPILRGLQLNYPALPFTDPLTPVVNDILSTAPHGFKAQLTCTSPVASFKMSDTAPSQWAFEVIPSVIDANTGFIAGDVLHISSDDHDRYVYIMRGAAKIHLAHRIKGGSVWPTIFPGENTFTVTSGFTWNDFYYKHAYWGV